MGCLDGGNEVGVERGGGGLLKTVVQAALEDDMAGPWMASKPVAPAGLCSVPSPLHSFSILMVCMRRVSNEKSIMEDTMALDISHGEKAAPERVYFSIVSKRNVSNNIYYLTTRNRIANILDTQQYKMCLQGDKNMH